MTSDRQQFGVTGGSALRGVPWYVKGLTDCQVASETRFHYAHCFSATVSLQSSPSTQLQSDFSTNWKTVTWYYKIAIVFLPFMYTNSSFYITFAEQTASFHSAFKRIETFTNQNVKVYNFHGEMPKVKLLAFLISSSYFTRLLGRLGALWKKKLSAVTLPYKEMAHSSVLPQNI